ncbi:MAG: PQQ-like beta-propeller repeat protein [Acidobacteria bacterium]|nr:PQQ-like beta-propeller repeat protein [Acidobacteriota bacterium]
MKSKVTLIAMAILLFSACVFAADWPQYFGPDRDSTSTEKGILRAWPEEGPKVLWTIPLGVGFGGPAVVGGKVYLLDRDEKVGDTLRCLDLSNGKEIWNFAYDAPGSFMFPGSRTSPNVDGEYIYTIGPMGDLYCINTGTHKPVWNKNIWKDFGGGEQLPRWGVTQNPLIYGDLLIVAPQTSQAGVVAYDKGTGELKWKSPALAGAVGYVSPSVVKIGGEDHLVMITASEGRGRSASGGSVNGLDPKTGIVLWTYENWQCIIPVPHAVDAGEGRVLITGGYNAGAAMIKVEKKAEGRYEATELFKNVDFGSHTQPPILYKDHFYAQYTTNERNDGFVCMSMDGQVKWKTGQNPAFVRGGSVLADGLLLSVDGNTKLYLVDPDPSGFKPLASVELLEPGENWAPMALVDGKLIIRDQKSLKCLVVGQ